MFDVVRGTAKKYHLEGLCLQLIAARLIGTELRHGQLKWALRSQDVNNMPTYVYEIENNWHGIFFQDSKSKRNYQLSSLNLLP